MSGRLRGADRPPWPPVSVTGAEGSPGPDPCPPGALMTPVSPAPLAALVTQGCLGARSHACDCKPVTGTRCVSKFGPGARRQQMTAEAAATLAPSETRLVPHCAPVVGPGQRPWVQRFRRTAGPGWPVHLRLARAAGARGPALRRRLSVLTSRWRRPWILCLARGSA